jgi:hypothetical protein
MHPERVVIARVSAVVAIIVIATVVAVAAAVGAFGSLVLGHLFPKYKSLSSLLEAAHELGLRSSK